MLANQIDSLLVILTVTQVNVVMLVVQLDYAVGDGLLLLRQERLAHRAIKRLRRRVVVLDWPGRRIVQGVRFAAFLAWIGHVRKFGRLRVRHLRLPAAPRAENFVFLVTLLLSPLFNYFLSLHKAFCSLQAQTLLALIAFQSR